MDEKNINDINNEGISEESSGTPVLSGADTPTEVPSANEIAEPENVSNEAPSAINTVTESTSEITTKDQSGFTYNVSSDKIEEPQQPTLDSFEMPKVQPAAYAFRWEYGEQRRYDNAQKPPKKTSKGVVAYAIILSVVFAISLMVLAGAIVFGEFFAPSFGSSNTARPPMQYSDDLALDELYEACVDSYVAISTTTQSGSEGVGSGIIITEDGYISTNYHVVENAKKITVILSNGDKREAKYIDGDEVNDIAVLKIQGRNLPAATLGDSDQTKVGERVMAIGTPYSASYAGSMTAGYVSGINRQYAVKNSNGTVNKILKLIQTDTSVNPGNSGGPLFNMNGEVIGVVTMKIAGSNYEGMGFALPINGVRDMIFDIIENGEITDENAGSAVQGAALGISGHAIIGDQKYLMTEQYCIEVQTDENGKDYIEWAVNALVSDKIYVTDTAKLEAVGLEGAYPYLAPCTGVLVKTTSEGFDSHDKLEYGDIIVSANGVECETMTILQDIILNSRIGDVLELSVYRNERYHTISVELGTANSME